MPRECPECRLKDVRIRAGNRFGESLRELNGLLQGTVDRLIEANADLTEANRTLVARCDWLSELLHRAGIEETNPPADPAV